jgi:hypothetical protein
MLAFIPNSVCGFWEIRVSKISDRDIDHIRIELNVPVDGTGANGAKILIKPAARVSYPPPTFALT